MKACGIVFTDLLSLDGQYQNNPSPSFTSDKDAAGGVEAVVLDVSGHIAGQGYSGSLLPGSLKRPIRTASAMVLLISAMSRSSTVHPVAG